MCFMCTYVHVLYYVLFYWYLFAVVGQISMLFMNNKDSVFWKTYYLHFRAGEKATTTVYVIGNTRKNIK